jgi:hypothetical protein
MRVVVGLGATRWLEGGGGFCGSLPPQVALSRHALPWSKGPTRPHQRRAQPGRSTLAANAASPRPSVSPWEQPYVRCHTSHGDLSPVAALPARLTLVASRHGHGSLEHV